MHTAPSGADGLVPSESALELALAAADDLDTLSSLRRVAAAHHEVARRCTIAFDDFLRLAVFRIKIERKLGLELARRVRRGGRGSKSPEATSMRGGATVGLPPGITKQTAAKLRALAAVPDDILDAYLDAAGRRRRIPTPGGALAHASRSRQPLDPSVRGRTRRKDAFEVPATVHDAIRRFVDPIDTYIHPPQAHDSPRLGARAHGSRQHLGTIVIVDPRPPADWLVRVAQMRAHGYSEQVVMLLPASTGERWFQQIARLPWRCCFVSGTEQPVLVLYLGPREAAFDLTFRGVGTLMTRWPNSHVALPGLTPTDDIC